jgi:hypothetical protein
MKRNARTKVQTSFFDVIVKRYINIEKFSNLIFSNCGGKNI